MENTATSLKYLPTVEAYDRWARVYDTDGNFLQAMDNIEMRRLFPAFISSITSPQPWRLVDLGCGTGRNTALLLGVDHADIVALDASSGMLQVAKTQLQKLTGLQSHTRLSLELFDLMDKPDHVPDQARSADGIISTLVVEHTPLPDFFRSVSQMLKPGGVLLLTNMHSDMGAISQAGFVDETTGEKIRPTSFAHTPGQVMEEAAAWGLEPVDGYGMEERAVALEMIDDLGPRSKKWVGIKCWYGGLFLKRL